jgi:hypothetical protein
MLSSENVKLSQLWLLFFDANFSLRVGFVSANATKSRPDGPKSKIAALQMLR